MKTDAQRPIGLFSRRSFALGTAERPLAVTWRTMLYPRVAELAIQVEPGESPARLSPDSPTSSRDLAVILDQTDPRGSELVFVRRGQKLTVQPAQSGTALARRESDAEWYARMRRYFAAKRGEALPEVEAPKPPPKRLSDAEWYAKMQAYFKAKRAQEKRNQTAEDNAEEEPKGLATSNQPKTIEAPSSASDRDNRVAPVARMDHLTIGAYLRNYLTSDGSPLSHLDQSRLDLIAQQAVTVCERELGPLLAVVSQRVLPSLQVDVTADLSELSDEAAAEAWGHALAESIRAYLRRGIAEIGPRQRKGF